MENFARLATGMDVAPLIYQIGMHQHLWNEITARQDVPNSPHIDTKSIFLRWCPTQTIEAAFKEIISVDYPASQFLPEAYFLVDKVKKLADGDTLGRILLVDLKPNGYIAPHADEGDYADYYERFHVSLRSGIGNKFYSEVLSECGEFVHMRPGEVWWFDHKKTHYVWNGSDEGRLHLIVDMVAPKYRRERDGSQIKSLN